MTPSTPLIEAVPNFAEGRRADVMAALVSAIQAPGVRLLDWSADADHHRSVITVAGAPDAVVEGLFRAATVAAERIDLREHSGTHPRLGALDVAPLVPLAAITLDECVAWARRLGARIGDELGLPVYLYAAAAARQERRLLAEVRRGEYEALVREIGEPWRAPDFGPARVGPAGAVIVGARTFLIAFNVYLQTDDVRIARRIARAIRERDGGLPGVRALGMLVDGRAQVSVNLVDFAQTALVEVVEAIVEKAASQGIAVDHSELIGLIPRAALPSTDLGEAARLLRMTGLAAGQVVEEALVHRQLAEHASAI